MKKDYDVLVNCIAKKQYNLLKEKSKYLNVNNNNIFGITPLLFSIKIGDFKATDILLNNNANPFIKTHNGESAFNNIVCVKNINLNVIIIFFKIIFKTWR